jgi:CRP-like cAMP-binding protein
MAVDVQLLTSIPLFKGLTAVELDELASHMQAGQAEPGQVLIREGDPPGHPIYLLTAGSVDVVKHGVNGRDHIITTLLAPSVFGEIEVLACRPAIAGVVASSTTRFASLGAAAFDALCQADRPSILKVIKNLARTLSYRLAATDERLASYFSLHKSEERQALGQVQNLLYAGWQTEPQ